jgi:hypothetical protein
VLKYKAFNYWLEGLIPQLKDTHTLKPQKTENMNSSNDNTIIKTSHEGLRISNISTIIQENSSTETFSIILRTDTK